MYSVQAHRIFVQLHKMNLDDMRGKTIAKVSIFHLMFQIHGHVIGEVGLMIPLLRGPLSSEPSLPDRKLSCRRETARRFI